MASQSNTVFQGNSQMHALCRQLEWENTILGPVADWSQSLRTAAALVLAAPFPNLLLWGEDLVQIYNGAYLEIMGDKHPGGLGQPVRQSSAEGGDIHEPTYQRVWAGESLTFEDAPQAITREGSLQEAWFTIAYSPVRDDSGNTGGILVAAFETTNQLLERKERENALQELAQSEERFARLVGATSDIIYTMSADWRHMIQLDGKEYLQSTMTLNGTWMEEYIPEDERLRVWTVIQHAIQRKATFETEHQVFRRDGTVGWVFSRAVPILDKNGAIRQWVGAASDITSRKQDERRQDFMLRLVDRLRPLAEPEQVADMACQMLVEHLNASRAQYTEVKGTAGKEMGTVRGEYVLTGRPMIREYPYARFGEPMVAILRSGQTLVITDTDNDHRLTDEQKHAYAAVDSPAAIAVPLVKHGNMVGTFTIHHSAPREWSAEEIAITEEIADRTWTAVERAKAEELSRISEKRLRLATEAADMATWEWDLVSNLVIWNEQHFQIFGLSPQEAPVHPELFFRHIHPDDRDRVYALLQRSIQDDVEFDTEFRAVREDGVELWISGYGRVMERNQSGPILMSGIMLDITARNESEAALHRIQARQGAILESAKDYAIFTLDLGLRVRDWNSGAEHVLGYSEAEIIGKSGEIFFVPEDRAEGAPEYEKNKAIREGRAENERWHLRSDGSRFYGSGITSPLLDEAGNLIGLLKVMRDLTMQKQTDEALKIADKRKDEFLAMLAHELRNPLATVRNGISLLKVTRQNDAQMSDVVDMMDRQATHLVRMIDDLLDVSRVTQGKIQLQLERLDVAALINSAVKSIRSQYEARRKVLDVETGFAKLIVEGDATRLSQVVTNLLTNSLRYTGDEGHVWVTLTSQNGEAVIRVRDNGIGLTPEQQTSVFELFVQGDNSLARTQGGLGIGLTIVRQLVGMHGGRVEAKSPGIGMGSEFTVYLPLLESNTHKTTMENDLSKKSRLQHILLIDDLEDLAVTTAMLLKIKGYQVDIRTSGKAGAEAVEAIRPSVVLCDIGMPELDGYQTAQLIRSGRWGGDVILLALSGYGQDEDKQQAMEAGFDGHLTKPVDMNELQSLIQRLTR